MEKNKGTNISDNIDAEMSRKEKREERESMKCRDPVCFLHVMKNSNVIVQKLSMIIDPYEDYSIFEVKNVITDEYFLQVVSHVYLAAIIGADAELFTLEKAQHASIKHLKM